MSLWPALLIARLDPIQHKSQRVYLLARVSGAKESNSRAPSLLTNESTDQTRQNNAMPHRGRKMPAIVR